MTLPRRPRARGAAPSAFSAAKRVARRRTCGCRRRLPTRPRPPRPARRPGRGSGAHRSPRPSARRTGRPGPPRGESNATPGTAKSPDAVPPVAAAISARSTGSRSGALPLHAMVAGEPGRDAGRQEPAPAARFARPSECDLPHAAHSRATVTSSNGSTMSPTIWPCSCPLPAISTMSSGPAPRRSPRRSPRAGRRSRVAPGAPSSTSRADRGRVLAARIVVGDDHHDRPAQPRPGPSSRACPGRGRRPRRTRRSAGPPACGRSAAIAASSASGVCA